MAQEPMTKIGRARRARDTLGGQSPILLTPLVDMFVILLIFLLLSYSTGGHLTYMARSVLMQVARIGLVGAAVGILAAAVTLLMIAGEFDLSMGWTGDGDTPWRVYNDLMSTETVEPFGESSFVNWHRFGDDEATELLRRFETISDFEERRQVAWRLSELFIEKAPAIPMVPHMRPLYMAPWAWQASSMIYRLCFRAISKMGSILAGQP